MHVHAVDALDSARHLVAQAAAAARDAALARPGSTWIDAFAAIDQCLSQLSWAAADTGADAGHDSVKTVAKEPHSCLGLLEQAERVLSTVPAGQGPPSLALVRAYLTEAIVETIQISSSRP